MILSYRYTKDPVYILQYQESGNLDLISMRISCPQMVKMLRLVLPIGYLYALRDLRPIVKRITILRYQDIDNVYNGSFMVIQIVKVSGLICIGNPG